MLFLHSCETKNPGDTHPAQTFGQMCVPARAHAFGLSVYREATCGSVFVLRVVVSSLGKQAQQSRGKEALITIHSE